MKVLIANRGEIAVRVIRACRELGLRTVAVYSDVDRTAMHVRAADQAVCLGPGPAAESYLRIDRVIDAARQTGASLVHPGYGFLAENAAFAAACADAGLIFVGPTPDAIAKLGGKTSARDVARAAGVPVVPGTDDPVPEDASDAHVLTVAAGIGYPLLVKAVAGGGGKGMRTVLEPGALLASLRAARSEAQAAFGNAAVFLERRIDGPRHVEVQVLGDSYGTVVPFAERECSIQRRHQKLVEESPSTVMTPDARLRLADAARRVAAAAGYTNAGTAEFLVDADGAFYFLEMNTRLQVEHPVTEAVTGIDLVQWQLRLALGERLTIDAGTALEPRGHAIECRIIAEDPDRGFMPAPGLVRGLSTPSGPGVRDDRGVEAGFTIPLFYDSLIAKLIVWGEDRPAAIARLTRVLDEYRVAGVATTLPFFRWLVRQPSFQAAEFDTTYLDRVLAARREPFSVPSAADVEDAVVAAAAAAFLRQHSSSSVDPVPRESVWRQRALLEGLR